MELIKFGFSDGKLSWDSIPQKKKKKWDSVPQKKKKLGFQIDWGPFSIDFYYTEFPTLIYVEMSFKYSRMVYISYGFRIWVPKLNIDGYPKKEKSKITN